MSEQMRIMRSKELPEELRDRIVARHRSGQGYKNISAALKVPKSTVASIILKWKTFGTTRTLPRAGRPAKLSYRGRRALVREVKKSPDLNPIEHLWRDLKMAVHQRLPSNLTELERICKEEWQRIPKSRCEKLVASFPKRLMTVLNQKGASTKY